jgi:hypothetical protein
MIYEHSIIPGLETSGSTTPIRADLPVEQEKSTSPRLHLLAKEADVASCILVCSVIESSLFCKSSSSLLR